MILYYAVYKCIPVLTNRAYILSMFMSFSKNIV